jgi:UDP-N-acetylmuramyl tripeptide synthase
LSRLATGHRVVLVSATNGKTTTTRLLAAALEAQGEPVLSNHTGANLASGIASALAKAHQPSFAVLEVDERVLPRVFDALRPELLVLGNLSRDQLDRYGEVRSVGDQWRKLCEANPKLVVVANASDPHVVWAASPADTSWVRLGAGWRGDAATCPQCGELLAWTPDGYSSVCGFAQPSTDSSLDGAVLMLGTERVKLDLALPGRWNVANAALAVVAATRLGVRAAHAAAAAATVTTVSGRYATYHLADGRPARVLLAKNPAGWTEVIDYLATIDTSVVLAVNAHIADGKDPSWLWDVPYERLIGKTVAVAGERALDVAVRLRHAGVDCVVDRDPIDAAQRLSGDSVHVVASYTQFHHLTKRLS